MESDGQEFGGLHEGRAELDGSSTSSDEEDAVHVQQPARISLSSLFARTASQQRAGPGAVHDAFSSQERGRSLDRQAAAGETEQRGLPDLQTSALLQFLPYDAEEIQEWHPNRILAAVLQFVASRVGDSNPAARPRRWRTKGFDPVVTIRSWARSVDACVDEAAGTWEQRSCGKRFFVKVMRIACRLMSQRTVQDRANTMWKRLSREDMLQWARLRRIVLHEVIAPHVQELSENHHSRPDALEGQHSLKKPRTAKSDTERTSSKTGYGFMVILSTSLGQDDPEVIKIVQSGATGATLRHQLKRLQIYTDASERLWNFANTLASKYHFATVNVTLEHSEHRDHKARVHFHFFIGIDLSGGTGFVQTPTLRTISYDEFEWHGIRPRVSPTMPIARAGAPSIRQQQQGRTM